MTVGVINAVTEVSELADRKLVDDDGKIIQPADKESGCDLYISTSSAGGGLQMMVAGVIAEMTAASAKRAALGAGAIVMDVIASNDKRKPHDRIQRIRDLRPDMMLISGGTDGGTLTHIMEIAELIAPAKPQPRFGSQYSLPIIYAGNKNVNLTSDNHSLLLRDDDVNKGVQTDLDEKGIAKTARDEQRLAREASKIERTDEDLRMEKLYREQMMNEPSGATSEQETIQIDV